MFKKILLCLLISFLFCQCYSKKWTTIPDKKDIPLEDSLLLFHWKDNEMAVANGQIIDDHIHGYARPLNYDPSKSKEVHIYLDSFFMIEKRSAGKVFIPLKVVDKIKTVENVYNPTLTGVAIGGGIVAVIALLVHLMGEMTTIDSFSLE
jgi:hypothetical protein